VIQAVRAGYTAMVLEQRCFCERKGQEGTGYFGCHHTAMGALLLGRTLVGERVWDISRSIDLLETLPEIDASKIACMGNSGSGTASYYAAGLIAPRPLVIVTGRTDPIFPLQGVEDVYKTIKNIYTMENAPENVRLVIGNGPHRFNVNDAWPVFQELSSWNNNCT
jgi:hypothetical protein